SGIEIHLPRQVVSLVAVAHAMPVAVPAPVAPMPPAAPPDPVGTLEVSNGNGVTGAAARLRRWLAAHDMPTHRLTNQRPFVQRETVVEYRRGHEAAARRLVAVLPLADRPATVAARAGLRTDVRIVLGHDWARIAAC